MGLTKFYSRTQSDLKHTEQEIFSNCALSFYLRMLQLEFSSDHFWNSTSILRLSIRVKLCQKMSNNDATCKGFKLLHRKATQTTNKKIFRQDCRKITPNLRKPLDAYFGLREYLVSKLVFCSRNCHFESNLVWQSRYESLGVATCKQSKPQTKKATHNTNKKNLRVKKQHRLT